ncbi:hypothetical protein VC83_00793 [Pseudogymnoascus destructans]|uniref:Uncharacterized protein n=1 Tax=Pseudogymnoascus destructans TaxID=655981 RepID=A0A177AJX2_9PEZI|nr:uncharacterized protein VC83_00793 [Pseudogymnoascus destructans]OAF62325.1 hypothetical protein VC83_00793 [Pseudogymnoascus destructans]
MQLDWFHWNLSLAWIAVMTELIIGTIPREPPIRLLTMPVPSMVFAFRLELVLVDALRLLGIPSPVRISSVTRGAPLRPGVYSFIEDVCAVDGSGGTEFRQRLNLRNAAYVIGWTVPFGWAAVWTLVTTKWVQKSLEVENKVWREEKEHRRLGGV